MKHMGDYFRIVTVNESEFKKLIKDEWKNKYYSDVIEKAKSVIGSTADSVGVKPMTKQELEESAK